MDSGTSWYGGGSGVPPPVYSQSISKGERMLGDKVGELSGEMTGLRILETSPAPVAEISFRGEGHLLGVDTQEMGTYTSEMRADGTMLGEGRGVSMGAGGEVATWRGNGVGVPTGEGMGAKWRGAIYYETSVEAWAKLNAIAVVYEFDVAADGKLIATTFAWS